MKTSLARRAVAEFTGTAFLVAAVIGSGVMGERLANGNLDLALLANTILLQGPRSWLSFRLWRGIFCALCFSSRSNATALCRSVSSNIIIGLSVSELRHFGTSSVQFRRPVTNSFTRKRRQRKGL
jgi:hypothetical protein